MNFGPASSDLLPGAKNAVETCLAIRPGEHVALIADEPSRAVAASLSAAMENVHAACTSLLPGELGARMTIVKVVERRQIRYAHMVGVTPEIMQQGMRADYRLIDRLSDKLRERMLRAETLMVKTDAGTEFAAHFDRGLDWVKTSGLISPRYWSNLPAGEVFTTPATVDGTFVCDATAGDHFNGKYGDL